jgi:hypothetical protein
VKKRIKTVENSFPFLVVTTDNFTAMKKRIKTVENFFPFRVVTTDNFTAMRKEKEEKQLKILSHS